MDNLFVTLLSELLNQTGLMSITLGNIIMIIVGAILLYLGIVKKYEPFLLVGIGLSCIVANVPGSELTKEGGLFYIAYQGVEKLILPPLIFLGVGAMTDFGPMIANPSLVILGAAAHLGYRFGHSGPCPAAHLRTIFHHQGAAGHRPRPGSGAWYRQAARR